MEYRDLEYLAASATTGNFAHAAEAVGISTSTISRRVARLEDELGLALFERGHSGVRLTPAGRNVMQHARRVLGDLEALKNSGLIGGTGDVGEIRLGVRPPPIGAQLRNLLSTWRGSNPHILLTVAEFSDRDLVAAIEERRLELVLTVSQALWRRAVVSMPLYRERLASPKKTVSDGEACIHSTDLPGGSTPSFATGGGHDRVPDDLAAYGKDKGAFDVVLKASGAAAAARPGAVIVQAGLGGAETTLPLNTFVATEFALQGTFRLHQEFAWAVDFITQRADRRAAAAERRTGAV